MIIPQPEFRLVRVDLSGMSLWQAWQSIRSTPPRMELTKDYIITMDDGVQLVFPAGFITDLASVPRALWAVPGFSPFGPLAYGAIPHDFGYQYRYLLTPKLSGESYPEPSRRLYEQFPALFGQYMPIFVGRSQEFFDNLLAGVTIEATGATIIAGAAELALKRYGGEAWNNYRIHGPTAYSANSLGLPGMTRMGVKF